MFAASKLPSVFEAEPPHLFLLCFPFLQKISDLQIIKSSSSLLQCEATWSSPTSSYSFCKVVMTSFESLQGIKDALVDA